ncbi:TPA: type-F conjugative transfer system secretin TraK [Legionella pneumophila]|nr:type-F conjugative transfer system secretin TraK [Legionella pneumophila]
MTNSIYEKAKKTILLISCLCSGIVCASTPPSVIAFEEGEQFNLTLSSINFNRVFIEGESITKLSYPEHAITVDKSEMDNPESTDSSVYIKPNFQVPITLFLTTDKGHHVSLTLTPDESVGKTLRLVPRAQTKLKFVKLDTPDASEVDEAIAAMKAGETPKEFNEKRVIPSPFYIKKNIKVTLEKQYQGKRFTGYVYRLENTSNHELALTTALFAHKDAESLSLSDEALPPKKIAYLYGLYSNQG